MQLLRDFSKKNRYLEIILLSVEKKNLTREFSKITKGQSWRDGSVVMST